MYDLETIIFSENTPPSRVGFILFYSETASFLNRTVVKISICILLLLVYFCIHFGKLTAVRLVFFFYLFSCEDPWKVSDMLPSDVTEYQITLYTGRLVNMA